MGVGRGISKVDGVGKSTLAAKEVMELASSEHRQAVIWRPGLIKVP